MSDLKRSTGFPGLVLLTALAVLFIAATASSGSRSLFHRTAAASTGQTTIRVASNLVLVPVAITTGKREPVEGLGIGDFSVTEEGVPQAVVTLRGPGNSPLELAILLDVSGSVASRFRFEQEAGAQFLRTLSGPENYITVYSIGRQAAPISPRTRDIGMAIRGLMSLAPTVEATAFYDSLGLAARQLRDSASLLSLRVVVAISDGEDNFSTSYNLETALRELQHADCLFYSINPAAASVRMNVMSRLGQRGLDILAAETGGSAYLPDDWSSLPSIYGQIAADLQSHYLLGYYSSVRQGGNGYRKISVTIPGRPQLKVRARQGYYAAVSTNGETSSEAAQSSDTL